MAKIRLQNTQRRLFCANLEHSPIQTVKLMRPELIASTGETRLVDSEYQTHETLTILAGKTSDYLPEEILKNHAIAQAVKTNRLMVIR